MKSKKGKPSKGPIKNIKKDGNKVTPKKIDKKKGKKEGFKTFKPKNLKNKKVKDEVAEKDEGILVTGNEEEEMFIEFSKEDPEEEAEVSNRKKKKAGGFHALGLSHQVLKGIFKRGYKIPTPIQRKAIPIIMEGKDVVAMARTGSGKTAAFILPLFEKLEVKRVAIGAPPQKYPRAIILSPTRELAMQTMRFLRELGKFLNFKSISILGGDSMESQFGALSDKPDIVVATPGRLMHICVEMELKLDGVEYIVFDEADRLFEMGFGEQLSEILSRLPESRQTVLFSATLPKLLVEFTKAGLHDPQLIRLDVDNKLSDALTLSYIGCRSEEKLAILLYLLKNVIKEEQVLIFAATKHHVEYIHAILDEANIPNCYIYSSLDPSARKISLGKFRNKKSNILIVTDIAARGLDIPVLDNVINFHFPPKPKLFIHRVGRVARAGKTGTAYSIVSPDELSFLFDLHLFLGKPLKFADSTDESAIVVGQIPQDVIDEEINAITKIIDLKSELESLNKVSQNGYKQYLKSRPNASAESNKRAKEIDISQLPIHSSIKGTYAANPMINFISQIRKYRPNSTIFEIGPKAGSEKQQIMKLKRLKDQKAVEKHRGIKSVINSATAGHAIDIDGEDPGGPGKKDKENFINYLPKDHLTESALSVGTTFEKQIQESMMDMTGDDSEFLKKQNNVLKWDRKKKKFISTGNDKKAKKIQTESGTWITSSYKSDRYKSWKEKSKAGQVDSGDDDEDSDAGARDNFDKNAGRKPAFSRKLVKTGKNAAPKKKGGGGARDDVKSSAGGGAMKGKRFRTGIKRPEQILKDRKEKEKKRIQSMPKDKRKKFGKPKGGHSGGGSKFSGKSGGNKFSGKPGGSKGGGGGGGGFKRKPGGFPSKGKKGKR